MTVTATQVLRPRGPHIERLGSNRAKVVIEPLERELLETRESRVGRAHGMVEGKAASIGLQSASEVMLDAFSDATAIFSLSSLDGVQAQHQRHRMLR